MGASRASSFFSNSTSFTYFPFQIIHCDLWTSPIVSFTGYKYYLVLIDDYSHYTWTFPLRNKFDATARIQNFHAYILNQFHLSIQCIQCDNGGEFINNTLNVTMVVSLLTTRFAPFLPLHLFTKWQGRALHSHNQ
jgi:septin family protein